MSTTAKQELSDVREAVIDLYLDVKVRSNEEVNLHYLSFHNSYFCS
jgi:hypothetical protein